MSDDMITVAEAGQALGLSRSTIWRLIQRGALPSTSRAGRRLVSAGAVRKHANRHKTMGRRAAELPPFSNDHPMFRLAGAGRSGGRLPGARDKHAILDR